MKEEIRVCEHCGKKYNTTRKTQRYCCEDCRKKHRDYSGKKKTVRRKKAVKGVNSELVNDAVEARKRGMSYGRYQGWKLCEQQRREREARRK